LHTHGLSIGEIRVSTGLSERLIQEYLDLYEEAGEENRCLKQMLREPSEATEEPAEVKRRAWLR
jgi:transposase